ncbi:MAG: hypothetical protein WAW63_00225 [Candidatus Saccharimonadales bacterium]|nr:hypothetical protein [Candidatus Saccharibacteria bacterium]
MVIQHHTSGGSGERPGMQRARVPRAIYILAGFVLAGLGWNALFGDKTSPSDPFRIVTPGAERATEIHIQGSDGMQSVLVVLPGGTHAVPMGFQGLKDELRICQDKPLPYDAAAMLRSPQEIFAGGCAAESTIKQVEGRSSPVAIPGRDITVHVRPVETGTGGSILDIRATVER